MSARLAWDRSGCQQTSCYCHLSAHPTGDKALTCGYCGCRVVEAPKAPRKRKVAKRPTGRPATLRALLEAAEDALVVVIADTPPHALERGIMVACRHLQAALAELDRIQAASPPEGRP